QRVEQRAARLGLVAIGIARRQEALVAPPEGDARPVHLVTALVGTDGREHRLAHGAAREHDVRLGLLGEGLAHPLDETRRHSGGEARLVVVDPHASLGHGHSLTDPAPSAGAPSSASPFCTTSPKRSSGSSLRNSSARQSRRLRRGSEMSCVGCWGCSRVATPCCARSSRISPDASCMTTPWMRPVPVAAETSISTGASSCKRSHAPSSSVEGESAAPLTRTDVTGSYGG